MPGPKFNYVRAKLAAYRQKMFYCDADTLAVYDEMGKLIDGGCDGSCGHKHPTPAERTELRKEVSAKKDAFNAKKTQPAVCGGAPVAEDATPVVDEATYMKLWWIWIESVNHFIDWLRMAEIEEDLEFEEDARDFFESGPNPIRDFKDNNIWTLCVIERRCTEAEALDAQKLVDIQEAEEEAEEALFQLFDAHLEQEELKKTQPAVTWADMCCN